MKHSEEFAAGYFFSEYPQNLFTDEKNDASIHSIPSESYEDYTFNMLRNEANRLAYFIEREFYSRYESVFNLSKSTVETMLALHDKQMSDEHKVWLFALIEEKLHSEVLPAIEFAMEVIEASKS